MSHIVTGEVQIKKTEIDALRRAVEHLGAHLEDRQEFRWYQGMGKCEQVITNGAPGSFEIGLRRAPNSDTFELAYDSYGMGAWIPRKFGEGLTKLQDRFLAEVASDEFTAQGMSVEIHEDEHGGIVVDGLSYAEEV